MVPRAVGSHLLFQTFIRRRGTGRWLAHQAIFWGVMIATLMTFALAWGWIHFESTQAQDYEMFVFGLKVMTFAPFTWFAWITFHVLDIAAVLVIGGCGYFLWRRFRDREAASGQYVQAYLTTLYVTIAAGLIAWLGLLLAAARLPTPPRGR